MSELARLVGFIWDIDGVVVDTPHEEAWRIAARLWGGVDIDSSFYVKHVAGRPRTEGGEAILSGLGVYEKLGLVGKERRKALEEFCKLKNEIFRKLVAEGRVRPYEDAVRFIRRARDLGFLQAAASASRNASLILSKAGLRSLFDVDVCGSYGSGGKREVLAKAAKALVLASGGSIRVFVVFEDSPVGVREAARLGMIAVGVDRLGMGLDCELRRAGALIVVKSLSDLSPLSVAKNALRAVERYASETT